VGECGRVEEDGVVEVVDDAPGEPVQAVEQQRRADRVGAALDQHGVAARDQASQLDGSLRIAHHVLAEQQRGARRTADPPSRGGGG
jgi:hypothetical protein